MSGTVGGLASEPYPKGRGETRLRSTSSSVRVYGRFPDELPGLPPRRVVDFGIELHPGISPISMTPHRMAPGELQELRVQLQELLGTMSYSDALRIDECASNIHESHA